MNTTIDGAAPIITITSPEDQSWTNESQITISGESNEALSNLIIYVNQLKTQNLGLTTLSFSTSITLQEGQNAIVLEAADLAGNKSQTSLTTSLDTQAPVITLNPDGGTLNTDSPTLTVSYTDEGSGLNLETLNITLDGSDITNQFTIHSSNSQLSTSNLSEGNHGVENPFKVYPSP
ncbi:MAG: hypothetical protein HYS08_03435 [Chlamydiae bacterium]|nr:hypothetical protein [Chlamydiota bacterium]